ncbi:adenylyltransferase/cytidyltransferase family protein [Methanococcoides sp.]|uniref:adenylyltransferase/cytidyltransferase family protein n=1 Tax=Methanococcoides sp. TaxID=1966350 RepID=UPI00272E0EA4|nr:adenylyltransferase/cytidyltransferase family protein [Methanococcoides sp.]
MGRTAVGGTFEFLHEGHMALIRKAFEMAEGDIVDICLTSDEMARQKNRNTGTSPTSRPVRRI